MVLGSTSIASADFFRFQGSARGSVSFGTRYEAPRARYQQPQRFISSRMTRPATVIVRDHRTNQSWEVAPCHDVHYNVSGYYEGPAGNVHLVQRGNRIYGTFANGGEMNGVIENGKITYTWTGGGYYGRGFWYVDGRGQLIGTWGAKDSDSDGNWNLVLARR
jgi:hypothetical protein